MKAIIPVAGACTKLRPLTYTQPKALIPIAGKTILGVIVDQLLEAGVQEFVFVIGYLGEKFSATLIRLILTLLVLSSLKMTGAARAMRYGLRRRLFRMMK